MFEDCKHKFFPSKIPTGNIPIMWGHTTYVANLTSALRVIIELPNLSLSLLKYLEFHSMYGKWHRLTRTTCAGYPYLLIGSTNNCISLFCSPSTVAASPTSFWKTKKPLTPFHQQLQNTVTFTRYSGFSSVRVGFSLFHILLV